MKEFKLRNQEVYCIDVDYQPNLGFIFPFKIIIPKNLDQNPEVVYACNLPRDMSAKCDTFD